MRINNPVITLEIFLEKFHKSGKGGFWVAKRAGSGEKLYNKFFEENNINIYKVFKYDENKKFIEVIEPLYDSIPKEKLTKLYYRLDK